MHDCMWTFSDGFPPSIIERVTNLDRYVTWDEQIRRFEATLEYMFLRAREKSKEADSWRGFKVGCAMMGFKQYPDNYELLGTRWPLFYGCNSKPTPNSPKFCAEHDCLLQARKAGCELIIGAAVVGTPQEDDLGILHETLRPCEMCVDIFRNAPEIKRRTAILTGHLEESGIVEYFPFRDLDKYYLKGRS